MEGEVRIEYMPLSEIRRWPRNPKDHDLGALHVSFRRWGYVQPVLVDERTGTLVAGHGRLDALEQMRKEGQTPPRRIIERDGEWFVPVIRGISFDSDIEAAAYSIADNRLVELGGWIPDKLVEVLTELADSNALDGVGYDYADLNALIQDLKMMEEVQETQGPAGEIFSSEQIVEAAFRYYRERGFPYPKLPVHECMLEINKLAKMETEGLRNTTVGMDVANSYHPQRYHVTDWEHISPYESFCNDGGLRKALFMVLQDTGSISEGSLRADLNWVTPPNSRGVYSASNFRPGFALYMYRKYLPEGGVVLDTSMGYGGRLVGFLASRGRLYIGIDPAEDQYNGNLRLASDLNVLDRVELHKLPAEDVPHDMVEGRADFCFTSPPYFNRERYSDEPTQSWVRYSTIESWYEGFLRPMFVLQHVALKPGRFAAVVVDDIKIRSKTIPLIELSVKAAREAGFELVDRDVYPIQGRPGKYLRQDKGSRYEHVLVFRKA